MKTTEKIKQPVRGGAAKVPVVMQMEALECGAASLAMILAYYNKWIPLEQVRTDCGVSRDGSNARNLLKAARSYGLTAKGYRYEPEDLKKNGSFPCIIHWNFNHFVLLDGFKRDKAYLNDPARGAYTVPIETFDDSFTGVCLMFEPGEDFKPSGKPKSVLGFARKRLAGTSTASVNTQQVRFMKLNQYLGMVPGLVSALSNTAVLMLGVYLTMQGRFTVGMIMAFQGFLGSFSAPATSIISAGQTIQEMRTQMERVEDVMEYPPDVNYSGKSVDENTEFDKLYGAVEMKNVTFGYSRLDEPLIENFSLILKPGSRVAFVGASGCGKSTLSKLISGLYQPWSGEILFDGKPIKDIDRSVFTGSLAVVDQDIILFEDSIRNNIKMWDDSIEDFEMILAARDAQLHEDIMQRDGGYDYKLTEGCKDFSGGQRQRMEIARVLAQDPTIIILDEATSALDAKTEYQVVKSIKDRGITCIVVAHRLSTIRDCDEIIVMDRGRVVERGTHQELFAKGGLYTQLVSNE